MKRLVAEVAGRGEAVGMGACYIKVCSELRRLGVSAGRQVGRGSISVDINTLAVRVKTLGVYTQ